MQVPILSYQTKYRAGYLRKYQKIKSDSLIINMGMSFIDKKKFMLQMAFPLDPVLYTHIVIFKKC